MASVRVARLGQPSWLRRHIVTLGVLAAISGAILVLASGDDDRPEEAGLQFAALTSRVRGPGTRQWIELIADDGTVRDGWPLPMIARGEEVCFGFGRVDFTPARPTLARCVDAAEVPELPDNGVVSLVVIQAGFDTWHLLTVGGDADGVRIADADGVELGDGRIHSDGDLIALRLPGSTELSELSWIIGRKRIVCAPAFGAAESAEFCPTGATASG